MGSNQMLVGDITYIAKGRLWVMSDVAYMSALEAKAVMATLQLDAKCQ